TAFPVSCPISSHMRPPPPTPTLFPYTTLFRSSASELKEKLGELDTTVRKSAQSQSRQVTSTVRDSTRQVESLVQIYARFNDLKLPMPSTGGFAIDSQALGHLLSLVEERRPKKILELGRSEEHTSELQSRFDLVCRLLLE